VVGPLTKKARDALLRQGSKADEQREWQECIIDVLKVANAEQREMQTQLVEMS